jgi:hypothetical protein
MEDCTQQEEVARARAWAVRCRAEPFLDGIMVSCREVEALTRFVTTVDRGDR